MAEFKLTNKAVEDLSEIWSYTFEVWSERQADNYGEMPISNCQEITDSPNSGKNYDGIIQKLLGTKANRHIVFYRSINQNCVGITRILHERMDLKKRILD